MQQPWYIHPSLVYAPLHIFQTAGSWRSNACLGVIHNCSETLVYAPLLGTCTSAHIKICPQSSWTGRPDKAASGTTLNHKSPTCNAATLVYSPLLGTCTSAHIKACPQSCWTGRPDKAALGTTLNHKSPTWTWTSIFGAVQWGEVPEVS